MPARLTVSFATRQVATHSFVIRKRHQEALNDRVATNSWFALWKVDESAAKLPCQHQLPALVNLPAPSSCMGHRPCARVTASPDNLM
jgi:hypothetical protein